MPELLELFVVLGHTLNSTPYQNGQWPSNVLVLCINYFLKVQRIIFVHTCKPRDQYMSFLVSIFSINEIFEGLFFVAALFGCTLI